MQITATTKERIQNRLRQIYADRADHCLVPLLDLIQRYGDIGNRQPRARWDQRDVMLITYGDPILNKGQAPLATLTDFLVEYDLTRVINIVHLLPFYPYSSDDGFSVIDYRAVDPELGTWDDVRRLGQASDLMFDLVLNHISQRSEWFQRYLTGDESYRDFFIETDPTTDLSMVTRPRSLPLLTPFATSVGERHLWTSFSDDQIDLNFANPAVLLAMIDILLFYVRNGARFVRLDAIAYLWKEIGTDCIHRPQTHAVVKLMRDVLDCVAPHVVLLTETNVPHAENVSYFGVGDEAHMVYQFSLPPLLLDALLHHDSRPFTQWLNGLDNTLPDTTYFNFTASHDGVGVRPLEGLVSQKRIARLVDAVRERGGQIGTKRNSDGTDTPYELNISYVEALADSSSDDPQLHADRFLCSQALMLSLRGIPGVYFHSLVGTLNDLEGVRESGMSRRINRRRFNLNELKQQLDSHGSLAAVIMRRYRHLLDTRIEQPAFHPDGPQAGCQVSDPSLIVFKRTSPDGGQQLLVAANLASIPCDLDLQKADFARAATDLLSRTATRNGRFRLKPYQVAWLEA